jgi:hypothetical protein
MAEKCRSLRQEIIDNDCKVRIGGIGQEADGTCFNGDYSVRESFVWDVFVKDVWEKVVLVVVVHLSTEHQTKLVKFFASLNQSAYDMFVNGQKFTTLHAGAKTNIDLPIGNHIIYFKKAEFLGLKSNKVTVNISSPDDNVLVEARCMPNDLTASVQYNQVVTEYMIVQCSCGAQCKVKVNEIAYCDYCRKLLAAPPRSSQGT